MVWEKLNGIFAAESPGGEFNQISGIGGLSASGSLSPHDPLRSLQSSYQMRREP
jgi:hypothetical protein